jgi:hypothetical protein
MSTNPFVYPPNLERFYQSSGPLCRIDRDSLSHPDSMFPAETSPATNIRRKSNMLKRHVPAMYSV